MSDVGERKRNFQEAKDALGVFMRSPQAEHVADYLRMISGCEPIMASSPEKTAHNLGAYEVIKLIESFRGRQ